MVKPQKIVIMHTHILAVIDNSLVFLCVIGEIDQVYIIMTTKSLRTINSQKCPYIV